MYNWKLISTTNIKIIRVRKTFRPSLDPNSGKSKLPHFSVLFWSIWHLLWLGITFCLLNHGWGRFFEARWGFLVMGVLVWWGLIMKWRQKAQIGSWTFLTLWNLPRDPGSRDPNVLRTLLPQWKTLRVGIRTPNLNSFGYIFWGIEFNLCTRFH